MAVKVSGTTVIDGSRQLTNIAGLDATTISTIENNISSGKDILGTITGNATLDLSTGTVFNHTPTANTTFVFNNPPSSGTAYGFTLKLTGASVSVSYDLVNASYDLVNFVVNTQDSTPRGFAFKPDGTKMYVNGLTTNAIYQYSLSTAWDMSTASYDSVSFSVASSGPVAFKPDGTRFYVPDTSGNVNEYSLSTAWDVSTASYSAQSTAPSLLGLYPHGLAFKTDGTEIYLSDLFSSDIYQFSLSTAWSISTASYSTSFSTGSQESAPKGMAFKPDGTKMYIVGVNNDTVYQYSLSTAWDVSTASYDSVSFSVASEDSSPYGIAFKDDGEKMYILGDAGNDVLQYTTGGASDVTFTYPASVDWSGGTAPTSPANGEVDILTFYTDDGGTTYYGFQAGDAMA